MRPARLATPLLVAGVAFGLLQAPAVASAPPDGVLAPSMVPVLIQPVVQAGPGVPDRTTRSESTDPAVSVPAPTRLSAQPGRPDRVTIDFTAPVTTLPILTYEYSENGGVTWVRPTRAVTASPMTIVGLTAGVPYSISLRAIALNGTAEVAGATSKPVNFLIKAPKPPKPTKPVIFEADGKVLAKEGTAVGKVISVKPGASIKMRNVPDGAVITVADKKDPDFTVAVRETSKARMWTTEALPPARRLWITVTDRSGAVVGRINFKVDRAEKSFTVDVWPKGDDLGSGVPLVVDFGIPISNKAEVEKALIVTSDQDFGEAGWFWVNSQKAVFRPRAYWPGNAKITLDANLSSIEGAKGAYGPVVRSSFRTGDQVILDVSLGNHTMKYIRNGVQEREFKISGGKAGWRTEAGTKVLTAHISPKRLYNPDPVNGWDVDVRWAIRVNDNGEYIHDAPWNYSLGWANTSHGCTNMSVSDMQWLYRNTKFGDIAEYSGSPDKIGTDDYLAGYWNYSWPEWKRGSALWQDR